MSEATEKSGEALRQWKKDLDKRCAEHLEAHPEGVQVGPVAPTFSMKGKIHISVIESIVDPGDWFVYKNGERLMRFSGPTAHRDAIRFMNEVLKSAN